ncbi:MAG TPA: hypothetical protein VG944_02985 [Fimbriimonas sp.]|nr:hypothetical protein [Fimbriimonas sp.]
MIEIAIAAISLAISMFLALRLSEMRDRLAIAEQKIRTLTPQQPQLPPPPPPSLLEGLRVRLQVTQDHPHPVFFELLSEELLKEGVTEVTEAPDAELTIAGEVTCNGYAEVYYSAEFTCSTLTNIICTLIERPPHGDRPANLAIELVAKIKRELEKQMDRSERSRAIRELGSP